MLESTAYEQGVRVGLAAVALLLTMRLILIPTLVENFRQRVFELRRRLFLKAADGEIQRDRAYRLMMRSINGVLRFAEGVSFGRLMLGGVIARNVPDDLGEAIEESDPATNAFLNHCRICLGYEIARHLVLTSPVMWALLVVCSPIVVVLLMARALKRVGAKVVRVIGGRPLVRSFESQARALLPDDMATAS